MKTITLILTALLALNVGSLFADNVPDGKGKQEPVAIEIRIHMESLVPDLPRIADFSDGILVISFSDETDSLRPELPAEATFEDQLPLSDPSSDPMLVRRLAPTLPGEADFE